jgi:hydroxyethylthiazole kinase-like sugar kinase family protein
LREFLEGVVSRGCARSATAADLHTDEEGTRAAFGACCLYLERSQAAASRFRLTGRAGTTVEIACL